MQKILKNSLAGIASTGIYLVSRLLLTPFILSYVSLEEFGLWSFCFIIISFAGLTGSGISSAFIKFTAEFHSRNEMDRIGEIIGTGTTVLAGLAIVVLSTVWISTPLLLDLFGIQKSELRETAAFLIRGSVAFFLLDLVLSGFKSLLDGLQEIALSRGVWLASALFEVCGAVAFLSLGWGIRGVFWGYAVRCIVESILFVFLGTRRIKINFRLSFPALKLLYTFGGKMQILSFIGIFMTTFDRLVVTRMLGLEFAGLFELGRKFPLMGSSVTGAALDSFLPAGSAMQSKGNSATFLPPFSNQWKRYGKVFLLSLIIGGTVLIAWPMHAFKNSPLLLTEPLFLVLFLLGCVIFLSLSCFLLCQLVPTHKNHRVSEEIRELYLQGSLYLNLMNTSIFMFIAAASPKIMLAWVGPGYESATWVMSILSISVLINLSTGPGTALLRGMGKPELELEYAILNMGIAIIWIPVFIYFLELPGAALGTAASTITGSIYFIACSNRLFGISFAEYMDRTIYPSLVPIAGSVLCGANLLIIPGHSRLDGILQTGIAALLYIAFNLWFLKSFPELSTHITKGLKIANWRRAKQTN